MSSTANTTREIQIVDGLCPLQTLSLAYAGAVKHVVHGNQAETVRELKAALVMSQRPEKFVSFPLAASLKPSAANAATENNLTAFEKRFSKLSDKETLLDDLSDLFQQLRFNSSLRDDVILVADELVCNALFNAPQPDGRNTRKLTEIVSEGQMETREGVIKLGVHNGFLALTCEDQYGSLKPLRMLERVHKCLENGAGQTINLSESGTAGIGSYMVFSVCTSLFMCVQEGVKSQVCVLFPTGHSAKARSIKPKNIHWKEF